MLAPDWNNGGSAQIPGYGTPNLRDLLHQLSGLPDLATFKQIVNPKHRTDGAPVRINKEPWYWNAASALTADDVLVSETNDLPAAGRLLRAPGTARLVLPFTFATADAAVLLVVPAGCLLYVHEVYWTVTADLTGGASSALGVSSNKTGFTAKGALLGGASGDVAAALTAALSPAMGTIGSGFDTLAKRRVLWKPGDNIRLDRVTSAFTAGAGAVNIVATVLANDGA